MAFCGAAIDAVTEIAFRRSVCRPYGDHACICCSNCYSIVYKCYARRVRYYIGMYLAMMCCAVCCVKSIQHMLRLLHFSRDNYAAVSQNVGQAYNKII